MHLQPLWETSYWLDIGLVLLCGGLIGLERQLSGKPAGIRTNMLICLGTFLFIRLGAQIEGGDPTRVLGQVVVGVGFLGTGVIITRYQAVHGLTSAAVIWVVAGIGAAVGMNQDGIALSITVVTLVILAGVDRLETLFKRLRRGAHDNAGDSGYDPDTRE